MNDIHHDDKISRKAGRGNGANEVGLPAVSIKWSRNLSKGEKSGGILNDTHHDDKIAEKRG
ncbi:hypothetical protein [Yanshouia hominis]|uniref:Uncharacterized protein n=1 Tax=Yanshouia hominis TaxID=2763673 RepID=A0ABR7NJ25_9FIRM|nr:hypothetical protein [Yanshouia hominis]MBC8576409.1 hypothetical protein [Yanshouia hominis]